MRGIVAKMVALVVVSCLSLLSVGVCSAGAVGAKPEWRIDSFADSTVTQGGKLEYLVQVTNVGEASSSGEVVVTGQLPVGLKAVEAKLLLFKVEHTVSEWPSFECTAGDGSSPVAEASSVMCKESEPVEPANSGTEHYLLLRLVVEAEPSVKGTLTSLFAVSEGGAEHGASTVDPTRVSETLVPAFGVDAFDGQFVDAAGKPSTQAGAHPADATVSIDFNSYTNPLPLGGVGWPVQPVKDVLVDLPPGMVGDPNAADRCTGAQLLEGGGESGGLENRNLCPPSSQVGTILLRMNGLPFDPPAYGPFAIYNMVAPANVPARFAFKVAGTIVVLDARLRSGGDYGISIDTRDISEALPISGSTVTFWGVPSDPVHDRERTCLDSNPPSLSGAGCASNGARTAFLRNPTSCTAAGEGLTYTAHVDSWDKPGAFEPSTFHTHLPPSYPAPPGEQGEQVGTTGCGKVPFTPSISPQPTSTAPDSPTGFNMGLGLPQSEEPETVGESDLRNVTIHFPEGMTINPAAGNGLAACTEAQIGLSSSEEATCPDASKLGTVQVETPLLTKSLSGALYLAAQSENPFHSLLATYLVLKGSGVVIKLPGKLEADPSTGRLTAIFDNIPQLPFSNMQLELFGGAGAPLSTPATCGSKPFSSELVGWNGQSVNINSPYTVECSQGLGGFTPTFVAGSTNPQAGAFTPFTLSISRKDAEQQITGLTDTFPPGVSAVLKGVERCTDAQVKATEEGSGSCPAGSRIGSVAVASGSGTSLLSLKGTVYLTGPYNNGPFGEAVVVPAVAGPFNLGNVVVRGSIRIDPHTAQATVVSDPFPLFVKSTGIPTDIRRVDVNLDREKFTFNPTNCNELHATGTLTGAQGATANVSSRFQAANCATLAFKPSFKAFTGAKVSRNNGASLKVVVKMGAGQANIRSVKVKLPKKLASRLSTLQQACTEATFAANPAACPAGSVVGSAKAVTPILASPLTGPAYFVSHGGAKFPELVIVLQGEGVKIELDGETFIDSKGITSSTFRSVPDAPVSSFELSLPVGPHSALGSKANLCKSTLVMPTLINGQNGAVVKQSTKIAVSGCPKHHKKARKRRHRRHKKG